MISTRLFPCRGRRSVATTGTVVLASALVLAGCSGAASPTDDDADTAAGEEVATTITQLDGYTDETSSEPWQQMLDECSATTGITINRQSLPTKEMIPTILRQASGKTLSSLIFIDNPYLQQLASSGAITPLTDLDFDTTGYYQSIIDAGTYDGTLYGVAPGVNALALFYNTEMFDAAGIEPPTDWAELQEAAATLTQGNTYGLAYSALATEEGTWQYLPFFWGAGADFDDLASPEAVQSLEFLAGFVRDGYASPSVINWNQAEAADQFLAGQAAMVVTGSWNLANFAAQDSVQWAAVPIPAKDGGNAPVALGGEIGFVSSTDEAQERAAAKVLECMTSPEHQRFWAEQHAYVPALTEVAEQLGEEQPSLAPFVEAVGTARSRSAELGEAYPALSSALIQAVQLGITGDKTAADALADAQATVAGN